MKKMSLDGKNPSFISFQWQQFDALQTINVREICSHFTWFACFFSFSFSLFWRVFSHFSRLISIDHALMHKHFYSQYIFIAIVFTSHYSEPNKIIINETFVKRWINCDKYNDYYVELCDQCALDSTSSQFHE